MRLADDSTKGAGGPTYDERLATTIWRQKLGQQVEWHSEASNTHANEEPCNQEDHKRRRHTADDSSAKHDDNTGYESRAAAHVVRHVAPHSCAKHLPGKHHG